MLKSMLILSMSVLTLTACAPVKTDPDSTDKEQYATYPDDSNRELTGHSYRTPHDKYGLLVKNERIMWKK